MYRSNRGIALKQPSHRNDHSEPISKPPDPSGESGFVHRRGWAHPRREASPIWQITRQFDSPPWKLSNSFLWERPTGRGSNSPPWKRSRMAHRSDSEASRLGLNLLPSNHCHWHRLVCYDTTVGIPNTCTDIYRVPRRVLSTVHVYTLKFALF